MFRAMGGVPYLAEAVGSFRRLRYGKVSAGHEDASRERFRVGSFHGLIYYLLLPYRYGGTVGLRFV